MLARNLYIIRFLRNFQHSCQSIPTPRDASTAPLFPDVDLYTAQPNNKNEARESQALKQPKSERAVVTYGEKSTPDLGTRRGSERPSIIPQAQSALTCLDSPSKNETISAAENISQVRAIFHDGDKARRLRRASSRRIRTGLVRKILALGLPSVRRIGKGPDRAVRPYIIIVNKESPLAKPKKQPMRTKYASLTPWGELHGNRRTREILAPLSTLWSRRFAAISRHRNQVLFVGNWEGYIRHLLGRHMDPKSITLAWTKIPQSDRESRWQEIMLWALQKSPERALKLLDASITAPSLRPSRHVVEDCINYLSAFYLEKKNSPDLLKIDTLLRIFCNFAEASVRRLGHALPFPQHALYLLLKNCDNRQTEFLFETFRQQNIVMHENTLLHFLERFLAMGKVSRSMEILRNLVTFGVDVASDRVQSACVKLLRFPFPLEDRYNTQSRILAEMLEIGIRPSIIMYNVILLNTIEAGDYQTTWNMYEIATANSLRPDVVTYSIMLKGAKQSLDSRIVNRIVRDVEEDGSLLRDQKLVRDLLDAVFALELSTKEPSVFTALLRTYARYCDVRPLQELSMVSKDFGISPGHQREVQLPSSRTLGLMILAYLKQHLHSSSDFLQHRYMRYRTLVQGRHPIIAPLAQTDHISNAFIIAFGRKPQSLEFCTVVIKHMLQPPGVEHDAKPVQIAIPTVQTWSILIAAYFRHGQKLAAVKVLKMMEARGMQPNKVTWNTVISGYSQMQDVDNAVGAMQKMEATGFDIDARTLEGLGRVRDRNRVLEALKKATEIDEDDQISAVEDGATTE